MTIRKKSIAIILALFLVVAIVLPLSCNHNSEFPGESSTTSTTFTTTTTTTSTTTSSTTSDSQETTSSIESSSPTTTTTTTTTMTSSDVEPSTESSVTEPTTLPVTPVFPIGEVFDQVSPAVVSVRVSIPATALYGKRDEIFSGMIVDESGLVITTYSLMERALDYRGRLLENASISVLVKGMPKAFPATLVGYQSSTDLALLKIQNPDKLVFHAIPLAKDPDLYVGTQIASIGYPPMMVSTGALTMGYVTSVYRRTFEEDGAPIGLIETSIATLPIYAGSPLVNSNGEVVAITSGYLKRIYVQNQGYAVPSPIVIDVIKRIQEAEGDVPMRKAALGITVLNDEDALELRQLYNYPNGLYISSVKPESSAYTAGLNQGDILISLNGEAMELTKDLMLFLGQRAIGTLVEIVIYRPSDDAKLTFTTYLLEESP